MLQSRLVLGREAGLLPNLLPLRKQAHVRQQLGDGSAIVNLVLEPGKFVGDDPSPLLVESIADQAACPHQIVEETEAEGPKGDGGLLSQVDRGSPGIEDARERDGVVLFIPGPLSRFRIIPDSVMDRDVRRGRTSARRDIAESLLRRACAACLLENADVAGLPGSVVALDNGEMRREAERLVVRESVHPSAMNNGLERHGAARSRRRGNMLPGERTTLPRFGETVGSLADLDETPDVPVRKLAADRKAPQRVALPVGSAPGPEEDFIQRRHRRLRGVRRRGERLPAAMRETRCRTRQRPSSASGGADVRSRWRIGPA